MFVKAPNVTRTAIKSSSPSPTRNNNKNNGKRPRSGIPAPLHQYHSNNNINNNNATTTTNRFGFPATGGSTNINQHVILANNNVVDDNCNRVDAVNVANKNRMATPSSAGTTVRGEPKLPKATTNGGYAQRHYQYQHKVTRPTSYPTPTTVSVTNGYYNYRPPVTVKPVIQYPKPKPSSARVSPKRTVTTPSATYTSKPTVEARRSVPATPLKKNDSPSPSNVTNGDNGASAAPRRSRLPTPKSISKLAKMAVNEQLKLTSATSAKKSVSTTCSVQTDMDDISDDIPAGNDVSPVSSTFIPPPVFLTTSFVDSVTCSSSVTATATATETDDDAAYLDTFHQTCRNIVDDIDGGDGILDETFPSGFDVLADEDDDDSTRPSLSSTSKEKTTSTPESVSHKHKPDTCRCRNTSSPSLHLSSSEDEDRDFLIDDEIADQPALVTTQHLDDDVEITLMRHMGSQDVETLGLVLVPPGSVTIADSPIKRHQLVTRKNLRMEESAGTLSNIDSIVDEVAGDDSFKHDVVDEVEKKPLSSSSTAATSNDDVDEEDDEDEELAIINRLCAENDNDDHGSLVIVDVDSENEEEDGYRPNVGRSSRTKDVASGQSSPCKDPSEPQEDLDELQCEVASVKTQLLTLKSLLNGYTLAAANGLSDSSSSASNNEATEDLKRQIVFLQQQLEERGRTVKQLQQQLDTTSSNVVSENDSTVDASSKAAVNAATQTDRAARPTLASSLSREFGLSSSSVVPSSDVTLRTESIPAIVAEVPASAHLLLHRH